MAVRAATPAISRAMDMTMNNLSLLAKITIILYLIIFVIEGTMVLESGRKMVCASEYRTDMYCGVEVKQPVDYPGTLYPIMNG